MPQDLGFHAHNGIFFKRTDEGDVLVTIVSETEHSIQETHTIPSGVWASVVASVSGRGETYERWQQALAFHKGVNEL